MKSAVETLNPTRVEAHRRGARSRSSSRASTRRTRRSASRSPSPASARARCRRASSTSGSAAVRCSRRPSTTRSRSSTATRSTRPTTSTCSVSPRSTSPSSTTASTLTFTAEVDVRPEFDAPGLRRHRGHRRRRRGHRRGRRRAGRAAPRPLRHPQPVSSAPPPTATSSRSTSTPRSTARPGGRVAAKGLSYQVGAGELLDGHRRGRHRPGAPVATRHLHDRPRWAATAPARRPTSPSRSTSVKERELPELDDDFAQTGERVRHPRRAARRQSAGGSRT